jgi:hypothetical protein
MKTTVELPDELFAEAKAVALRRRVSLKALFTRALERELRGPGGVVPQDRFRIDESGWPVLRTAENDATNVSDFLVNELRDSEGV